jgi:ABC-2 type transport system permease protein
MIREFFRFDLKLQRQSWLYWIIAVFFALLAFGAASTDAIQVGGAIGNVWRNAPMTIFRLLVPFTIIGMFLTVTFVASPLLRDADANSTDMIFSKPFNSRDLVIGRLLSGIVMCVGIYLLVALGMLVGSFAPWVDAARLGPTRWDAYLYGMVVLVLPNVIFVASIFAAIVARFRSLMSVYVGVIGLFVGFILSLGLTRDLDNTWLAALADPFAARALNLESRYWSTAELNTNLPQIFGYIGANRLLWLSLSIALLIYALRRFSPSARESAKSKSIAKEAAQARAAGLQPAPVIGAKLPNAGGVSALAAFWHLLKFNSRFVLTGLPFLAMLGFGLVNFQGAAESLASAPQSNLLPVTYIMVDAIQSGLQWLLAIVVSFYAGELVWRARSHKMSEMEDASPIGDTAPLMAKAGSLLVVIAAFALIGVMAGVLFQLVHSYTHFEPWVYASGLLVTSLPYLLIGLLAVALQVITGNKFLGYGAILLVLVARITMGFLDYTHNLWIFAGTPSVQYSDLNGWGQGWRGYGAFSAYWLVFVMFLMCIAAAMSARGTTVAFKERFALARARLKGRAGVLASAFGLAFLSLGAMLFYQTRVLNTYLSPDTQIDLQVRYEQQFKQYEKQAQPRVVAVKLNVDLYPSEKRMLAKGTLELLNREQTPISQLIVQEPVEATIKLELPAHKVLLSDKATKFSIYELNQPLAAGARMLIPFTSEIHARGIRNDGEYTAIVDNGSFFNNSEFVPRFGYQPTFEITDPNERRKRKLGEARRMPVLEDVAGRMNTYIANDSDWIDFEMTVSTDPKQIALAPGYLQREWQEQGRRYFHYKMDRPILNFYSVLSANWTLSKGEWTGKNGTDGATVRVPIEIYHHPRHTQNVATMIDSVKQSLDYFTTNFSPYQHKQVRIIEFPRYADFAQAFPNTIPFSEKLGFIADTSDEDSINYPFYVTAHEIAHQWWGHQVIGGAVQGSTLMSESMSQYSALMVMEKALGKSKMRQFLEYELDGYLRRRSGERLEELPLYRVENQTYLHYNKGSLVFYRLKEELGEATLNQALKSYVSKVAYQQAPFTVSTDLIAEIRAVAPADKQQLITDLFEKISFYDNRVEAATALKRDDGKYDVTLKLIAKKLYADGKGKETAANLDDFIDVGVFAANPADAKNPKVLYLKKHHIKSGDVALTITVDEKPTEAGFDPFNILIDRVGRDNRKTVTF